MEQSLLKKLPAEMRNRIYELALTEAHPIQLSKDTLNQFQPALPKTCKQIRAECGSLIYANEFVVVVAECDTTFVSKFLESLNAEKASLIRSLTIECAGSGEDGVGRDRSTLSQPLPGKWDDLVRLLLSKDLNGYRVLFVRTPRIDFSEVAAKAKGPAMQKIEALKSIIDYHECQAFGAVLSYHLMADITESVDQSRVLGFMAMSEEA